MHKRELRPKHSDGTIQAASIPILIKIPLTLVTQQLEIQLSVIHNYASQYLGLVVGSENPAAKS